MSGLPKLATRGLATFVALTMALVASLLIGGQLGATGAPQAATPGAVVAKNENGKMTSKVFGRAADGSQVSGKFTPLKFVKQDGKSKVKGVINGVVTHPNGDKERFAALRTFKVKKVNGVRVSSLTAPTSAAGALVECDVLNLVLGPLDLNLLGLEVHLNRVVLDVVAVSGAGNLLGNLLCAVAGLLDGGPVAGLLRQLTNLLNQILTALNLGI
jgi:hypothetical protein